MIGMRKLALLAVAALASTAARAEIPLFEAGGLKLGATLNATLGYVNTNHTNWNEGVDGDDNVDWAEGFLKAGLTTSYALPSAGTLYGEWVMVGAATWGGPDASGYNEGSPEELDQDKLYVGWKSGKLIPAGEDFLDVSYGQQDFRVGNGFLFWDGNWSGEKEGAYWLGPKTAFDRAGIVRISAAPARGDLFYLNSDAHSGHREVWGANAELSLERAGTFGLLYARVTDGDEGYEVQDGMNVYDARWGGTFMDRLSFALEGVYERNSKDGADQKAYAWYGEVGYTMAGLPWKPSISYRFSQFSGDKEGTDTDETFDPLFYGFGGGWGTWLQGEIMGEYLFFNSDERAHLVALKAQPSESLGVGLLLFRFDLDQDVDGERHVADEVNLYADWQALENLYVGAVAGVARARGVLEDELDNPKNYGLFEVMASLTF